MRSRRVLGGDIRAAPAGELNRIGAGQVEEPEIHRALGVTEDEVGLASARRRLRRNLDGDCVGELGWLVAWRFRLGKGVLRLPGRSRRDFRLAKYAALRAGARTFARGCARCRLLLLLRRHGKRRPVLPGFLRAHVVPSNEEGDGVGIVDGLNGDARRGRMERASRLHDLPDDGKAGRRSGREARGSLRQIDPLPHVLGDDEVGIARSVAARERDDEVGDRPSLLGRQRLEERRHRRPVQPRAHRPEDVLAGRPSPEGPALSEVRRAYGMAPVVLQRWRRGSVAPAEIAVALDAAAVDVELLPQLDGLVRGSWRARQRNGLWNILGLGEVGGERRQEISKIGYVLVGEGGPGGHRRVRHAAPDDVHEVLMRRQRSVGSRADLELAGCEVAGPWAQMRAAVAFAVTFLAVALRAVFEIKRFAGLPLCLGPDILRRRAHRSRERSAQCGDEHGEIRAHADLGEGSLLRVLLPAARLLAREIVEKEDRVPDLLFLQELLPGRHGRVPGTAFLWHPRPAL